MTDTPQPSGGQPIRFLRVLGFFGVATILVLLIMWGALGRTVVEKTATILALPCGVIWYVLTCCLVLVLAGRQRKLAVATFFGWFLYTLCGSGHFACLIVRDLESPFATADPLGEEPFEAVIVLGGGASVGANGRFQGNQCGDRLILAAQLYHAGIAPKLICTGKRMATMDGDGSDPSEISRAVLIGLGVPESAIERLGGHNTSEEMQTLSKRFADETSRVGIVTSAWHLSRAMRLARSNGLNPTPLPADFLSSPDKPQTTAQFIQSCMPRAENFVSVSRIAKEHLAGFVGR